MGGRERENHAPVHAEKQHKAGSGTTTARAEVEPDARGRACGGGEGDYWGAPSRHWVKPRAAIEQSHSRTGHTEYVGHATVTTHR